MANWTILKAAIADTIKTNGNQEITGAVLQNTLNSIVNAVGENATFAGVATPATNPGTPDGPTFYIASVPGIYSNFNGIQVYEQLSILVYSNSTWNVKSVFTSSNIYSINNFLYTRDQVINDTYLRFISSCIKALFIHYKNDKIGDDVWVIDSNGISNTNNLVITVYNITKNIQLAANLQLSDIKNEIVVLEKETSDYHFYAAINPHLYFTEILEAGGFNKEKWKRIFVEQKKDSQALSGVVFSKYMYDFCNNSRESYNELNQSIDGLNESIDGLNESIDGLNESIDGLNESIYELVPSENSYINEDFNIDNLTLEAASTSFYSNQPLKQGGFLKSITVKSITANSIEVFAAIVNADELTLKVVKNYGSFEINPGQTTTVEINDSSTYLAKNSHIFVRITGGKFYFTNTSIYKGFEYANNGVKKSAVVISDYSTIAKADTAKSIPNITSELLKINQSVDDLNKSIEKLQEDTSELLIAEHKDYIEVFSDDFSTKKSDWTLGDSWDWDLNNKILKPTIIGNINSEVVRLNRVYQCDKHILRFNAVLYTDTVLNIAGQRTNNNTGEGESFWQIDCAEKKLKMYYSGSEYNYWRGVDISRLQASQDILFKIVNGREYAIEVEKNNFTFYLRIFDTITGDSCILKNVGWNAGRLQYYYTFSLGGGTPFSISKLRISMINNPRVVFAGDSITEGVGMYSTDKSVQNSLYNRYAEIIRKKVGKSCISAVGGDVIDTIIKKFDSEYNIIKPKYLSVHIGTNGGISTNTENKFKQIIDLCKSIDCIPILNIISCGGSGNYIDINQMLLALAESSEYKGKFLYCRFDYATAVDNYPWVDKEHSTTISGQTTRVNSSLMVDNTHPNYLGSKNMATRYSIDIPEIFNA